MATDGREPAIRTQFAVGGIPIPLSHPAVVMMIMSRGQQNPPPGHLVIGREAANASLVIASPAVSATHATVSGSRSAGRVSRTVATTPTAVARRQIAR